MARFARGWTAVAGVALLLTGVATACSVDLSSEATVDEVTEVAEISLPPSAADVQVHREQGMDDLVLIQFTMPADQEAEFLAASGLPNGRPGHNPIQPNLGEQQLGWRLDDLEQFKGAGENRELVREYVIDTSDPDAVTVYLAAFTT